MVGRLAGEVDRDYPKGVAAIGVLSGSLVFLADFVRRLSIDVTIDFLAITPFAPDTGRVRITNDLATDLEGRDVLLVEDIVDTGLSAVFLAKALRQRGASTVAICTLLDRRCRRIVPVELAYVGREVPDTFVVGYGLGDATAHRNLPHLVQVTPDWLLGNPREQARALRGLDPPGEGVTDRGASR